MIEIGSLGFPYRSAAITTGSALQAESAGVDAVWFLDRLAPLVGGSDWTAAGPLAEVIPDPAAFADPVVASATALMVTRRIRVGVVLDVGRREPTSLAQTIASLTALAPERLVVGLRHGDGAPHDPPPGDAAERYGACLDALATAGVESRPFLFGGEVARDAAARLGVGWMLDEPADADDLARGAAIAEGGGELGILLTVVVHDDGEIAAGAAGAPLLAPLGLFSGTPHDVVKALKPYVDAGVQRIVLDNALAFGAPNELGAADRALHSAVRTARLTFRSAP